MGEDVVILAFCVIWRSFDDIIEDVIAHRVSVEDQTDDIIYSLGRTCSDNSCVIDVYRSSLDGSWVVDRLPEGNRLNVGISQDLMIGTPVIGCWNSPDLSDISLEISDTLEYTHCMNGL